MQFVATLAENISTIAIVLMAWIFERRRADRLEAKLITTLEIEGAKEA
jgi:hypothetical protein